MNDAPPREGPEHHMILRRPDGGIGETRLA
jgi:hypothetical protein